MGLNYIALAGEVITSPEKKHTPDGQAVTTFSINIPSHDESENKSGVIKISAIKKMSDKAINQIKMGDVIFVEGKLYTKILENKFSQKQKIPFIQATNIEVIKSNSTNIALSDLNDEPSQYTSYKKDIDDEEIPF